MSGFRVEEKDISGSHSDRQCPAVKSSFEAAGVRAYIPLNVSAPFHSRYMREAMETYSSAIDAVRFSAPAIPVISNVDAKSHADPDEIRQLLVRQVTQPVLWEDSVRGMLSQGVTKFYEVGPGKVLKGLLKRIDRKADCETVNDSGA